jgi:hypothetical protein
LVNAKVKPVAAKTLPSSHPPPLYKPVIEEVKVAVKTEIPKPSFINFYDPKMDKLKNHIISELNGNPSDEKMIWLNNLFHNIFMYPEFLKIVEKNDYLIIDSENQKLIRKKYKIKNIHNPEEYDEV